MSINTEDLDHVLKLTHLEIAEAEKHTYLPQLQNVLNHMKSLDKLDLNNKDQNLSIDQQDICLREDKVIKQTNLLLKENAPQWESNCFKVPKILD